MQEKPHHPEQTVLESEERFRNVFDSAAIGMAIAGADGKILQANLAMQEMLGYSADELKKMTVLEITHPDDVEESLRNFERMRDGQCDRGRMEKRYRRKDGRILWAHTAFSAVRDAAGKFKYDIAMVEDITERKKMEEVLRNVAEGVSATTGEQFFASLVEYLAKAIGVRYAFVSELAEADGSRLRIIALWTGKDHGDIFEYDIKGTPCEGVIGQGAAYFASGVQKLFPKDRWLVEAGIDSYLALPLFRTDGKPLGHVGVMHEEHLDQYPAETILTIFTARAASELHRKQAEEERARLEAQLQEAQKLESLGILAGGIAHDFNNLLTGVLGNASLALRRLSPGSPARDRVQQIEKAALRAADLTNQLLAYSGKGRFVVTPLDLSNLVEEMTHLLSTTLSKDAVLDHDLARNLPAIEADATQVRQIIMNLITNASEALEDKNGTIMLSTGVMDPGKQLPGDISSNEDLRQGPYVYLDVTDTGVGMDEETKEKMFDPFFTTKFAGRGLGLAAVLGIVRGHDGAIQVDSRRGGGTTIRVLFPATDKLAEEVVSKPESSVEWRGSGSVLVVDDEEGVREVTTLMLQAAGFDVLTANDGREGVEALRKHSEKIVAVLLDMTMPNMDGETAFPEIRRLKSDVPVILMSGYNEHEATSRFAGKGLAGFIQKPYGHMDLIGKLRQVLEPPS